MGSSTHLLAKRAFISVILALARAYQLIVDVNRDSDDGPILKAFRRVALKAHPAGIILTPICRENTGLEGTAPWEFHFGVTKDRSGKRKSPNPSKSPIPL